MAPSILGVSNGSGLFRSNRIAGPTCPNKEVWILAMLYVMFYVVISKISACLFAFFIIAYYFILICVECVTAIISIEVSPTVVACVTVTSLAAGAQPFN